MISLEQLEALKQKLAYSFVDDGVLKHHIALFYFHCIVESKSQLPFSETIPTDDWQMLTTKAFFAECRVRKTELHFVIHGALKQLNQDGSREDRKSYFTKLTKQENVLQVLADQFELSNLLSAEDPLTSSLSPNLALFICNAIFQHSNHHDQGVSATQWLAAILKEPYEQWRFMRQRGSYHFGYRIPTTGEPRSAMHVTQGDFSEADLLSTVLEGKLTSFEESVLSFSLHDIHSPISLTPLIDRFELSVLGRLSYFKQFLPYILEETREAIAGQYKLIQQRRPQSFQIILTAIPSKGHGENTVECSAKAKYLPHLDHTFAMEAVLIRMPSGKRQKKSDLLAIAAVKYFDRKEKVTVLKLYLKKESLLSFPTVFVVDKPLELHWLTGLMSFSRMHDACLSMPRVPFEEQILTGNLPPWPALDEFARFEATPAQSHLNQSQMEAVARFHQAASGLYFLLGPPGTGKTTTIVNLFRLLSQEPHLRILVCAPSNKAVRVLVENTQIVLPDLPIALTGVAKDLPPKLQPIFINDRANQLMAPFEALSQSLEEIHGCLIEAIRLGKSLNDGLSSNVTALFESLKVTMEQTKEACRQLTKLSPFRLDYQAREAVDRLLNTLVEFPTGPLDDYEHAAQAYQANLEQGKYNVFPSLDDSLKQSKQKRREITTLSIEALIQNLSSIFQKLFLSLQDVISLIANVAEPIEILLLQRAQIIFCTLVSSGRKWLKKYISQVDILIIDEAAQAVEPEIIIPFSFLPKKCLQVGDTKQLPATVLSKAAQARDFDRSMMFRLVEICGQYCEMLTVQYRMHPAICAWPSKQNYEGRLVADASLMQRPSPLMAKRINPVFKRPCVFFHVNGNEDRRSEFTQSIKNAIEATALIDVLVYLLKFLLPEQLGVISFYAAQIDLLKQKTREHKGPEAEKLKHVQISTVDGFQGGEKDFVLISAVRTVESVGFLREFRRLNVAMTRSKHHRICFGKTDTLARSNSDFQSIIAHHNAEENTDCVVVDYSTFKF